MRISRNLTRCLRQALARKAPNATQKATIVLAKKSFHSENRREIPKCPLRKLSAAKAAIGLSALALGIHLICGEKSKQKKPTSFEVAETSFKVWIGSNSEEDKKNLIENLDAAFKDLKVNYIHSPKMAKLFYMYGRTVYGGDMEASRQMFLLAFCYQIPSFEYIIDLNIQEILSCESLPSVKEKFQNNPKLLEAVDKQFKRLNPDIVTNFALSGGNECAFLLATTLRWLGHCYQNINQYNTFSEENLFRFNQLYGIAEKILQKRNLPEFNWELGQLYYNTGRFMHYLQHPNDVEGALATLQKVLPYLKKENSNRAKVLEAQICNITAIENGKLLDKVSTEKQKELLKSNYNNAARAYQIAEEVPEFNPFLKTMFKHNKAKFALLCNSEGIKVEEDEEIEKALGEVLNEVKQINYNHYYHSIYFGTAALYYFKVKKDVAKAKECLATAEMIALKYPDSSKDISNEIIKLKEEFNL